MDWVECAAEVRRMQRDGELPMPWSSSVGDCGVNVEFKMNQCWICLHEVDSTDPLGLCFTCKAWLRRDLPEEDSIR